PCGNDGQRACCIGEHPVRCNRGFIEEPGAPPNSRCRDSTLSSTSHCRRAEPHFELPQPSQCSKTGYHEYTATFVDGDRAECLRTTATLRGTSQRPRNCGEELGRIWGEFDLPDPRCRATFEKPSPGLCEGNKRWYRAYVQNTPRLEKAANL